MKTTASVPAVEAAAADAATDSTLVNADIADVERTLGAAAPASLRASLASGMALEGSSWSRIPRAEGNLLPCKTEPDFQSDGHTLCEA